MNRIIFTLTILFTSSLFAESIPPEFIEHINDSLCATDRMSSRLQSHECQNCHGQPRDDAIPRSPDYQRCAASICANNNIPSINRTASGAQRRAAQAKEQIKSQIRRALNELADGELTQLRAKSEHAISRLFGRRPSLDAPEQEIRAANLNTVRDFYPYAIFTTNDDGQVRLDRDATAIRFRMMNTNPQNADYLMDVLDIYVQNGRTPSYMSELGNRDPSFYASRFQTPFSRRRLVEMVTRDIRTIEERGDAESVAYYKRVVGLMPAPENMSEEQVVRLMRIRLQTEDRAFELTHPELRAKLADRDMAVRSNSPYTTAEQMAARQGLNRLEFFLGDEQAQRTAKEAMIDRCADRLAIHLQSLPTQQDVDRFNSNKQELISNFLSRATTQLSEESKGSARTLFRAGVDFAFPPTREGYLGNYQEQLKDIKNSTLSPNSPEWSQRLRGGELSQFFSLFSTENAFGQLEDQACQFNTRFHASDNELTETGSITINGPVLQNPELARGIANHEMSHLLARSIDSEGSRESKKWLNDAKSCLASKHKAAERGGLGIIDFISPLEANGEELANEDFADMISAVAGSDNYACNFIDSNPASGFDFRLESESAITHSTGFYRLLHMETVRNSELPEVCQNALRQNEETDRDFSSCMNPSATPPAQQ